MGLSKLDVLGSIIAPTLVNGWVNYGLGYVVAGYYKNRGEVKIQGHIKDGTPGSAAFVLPVDYRAPDNTQFIVDRNASTAVAEININSTSGEVAVSAAVVGFISFMGISFRAA